MGSYSQAITSRYEDVLKNGQILLGDMPFGSQSTEKVTNGYPTGYQFYTGNPNKIVMVRKHNTLNKWVISSTIQDNNNKITTPEIEQNTSITLNGEELTFRTRKQGSVYIYDKTDTNNTIFYQLDGWHEWKHPYYWDKNFTLEAELYDTASSGVKIKTELCKAFFSIKDLQISKDVPSFTLIVFVFSYPSDIKGRKSLSLLNFFPL
jgi:hypothetical protein